MSFAAAAIWGSPVQHSKSPLIHSYWMKQYGLSGAYLQQHVTPDKLPELLKNFANLHLAGVNLTLPLKEAACAYVDLDDTAAKLQAVNTLWLEGGKLVGTNSDVTGFLASLDEQAPHWRSYLENVVVLGAGGAAKAIIYALLTAGAERIILINRNSDRAEEVKKQFGARVQCLEWEKQKEALLTADLLVNTTSLGMMGQPPLSIDMNALSPSAIVADIVYIPLETELLRGARAQGLITVDGLGMLLHQAVIGFSRWFGVSPQVTPELRTKIAAGL